jgi:uncharacterized pyridoxamine 5'-phosphate oxidase family protein
MKHFPYTLHLKHEKGKEKNTQMHFNFYAFESQSIKKLYILSTRTKRAYKNPCSQMTTLHKVELGLMYTDNKERRLESQCS